MPRIFIITALFIFFNAYAALAEQITLNWDIPSESDIDGFRCFQRTAYADDAYHFDNPIKTSAHPDGSIGADINTLDVDVLGIEGGILKYMWVCRSFKGDAESENSNEVAYKVINTLPLTPAGLNGSYDAVNKTVNLNWDQPPEKHRVYKWVVFYKLEGDPDYTELAMVDYDNELTVTRPLDVVAKGERKTVYFTVISYRRSGVFSADSNQFQIDIDRRDSTDPPKPENLHIDIDIPVVD